MNRRQKKAYKKKYGHNPQKMYCSTKWKKIVKQFRAGVYESILNMNKRIMESQETRIIENFTTARQITPEDLNGVKRAIKTAEFLAATGQQALVITNAAMAAAIRTEIDREAVEVIISSVVEDGVGYLVTDENLKQQLLATIRREH